jgi:hypothetical protein
MTEPKLWPDHAELIVERGGFGPYTVELLFDKKPTIDSQALRLRVAERLSEVVDMAPDDPLRGDDRQAVLLLFPGTQVTFAEGSIPAQVALLGPTENPRRPPGL